MIRDWIGSLWLHRLVFLGAAGFITFLRLLQLDTQAGQLPGPDILLCLIFAWMVRRPEYLPALMIAAVLLVEDFLLERPPGLWTALVLVGAEFIRSRSALTRELNFGVEWLLVAGVMVGVFLGFRLMMGLAFLDQAPFGFALVQILWSILAYPAVVAFSRYGLDLHKPAMGEIDDRGRKL